jgi:hypothetical protein
MKSMKTKELRDFIREAFAAEVGLPPSDVLAEGVTLADVMKRSPKIVNSVDLMECFARTSNAVRKAYGIRVRLPAYPVNTTLDTIVDSFIEQVERQMEKDVETPC